MGHKAVKAALVAKLTEQLPWWTDLPVTVDRADSMPADDKKWPFVIVRTTRRSITRRSDDGTLMCTYRCQVTCGVRAVSGDRDLSLDEATDTRDDLIEAICNVLEYERGLGDGMRVTTDELVEDTAPSVLEGKGPAIAMGTTTFTVSAREAVPTPTGPAPDPEITDAEVTVTPHPADYGTLLGAS